MLLNSKELWRNLVNRAFFIDLTAFECCDKMACFDLKGRMGVAFVWHSQIFPAGLPKNFIAFI